MRSELEILPRAPSVPFWNGKPDDHLPLSKVEVLTVLSKREAAAQQQVPEKLFFKRYPKELVANIDVKQGTAFSLGLNKFVRIGELQDNNDFKRAGLEIGDRASIGK
jgi:hypothetical protein